MEKDSTLDRGQSGSEPLETVGNNSKWLERAAVVGVASIIALMFAVRGYVAIEDEKERDAQEAIALEAAAIYAQQPQDELVLTAEPQSLPSGDLTTKGVVRDWHSGTKSSYQTDRGLRNGVRADQAAREIVLEPRQCAWEYVGAETDEHPVQVLAWTSASDGNVTGEIIDVAYDKGVLDPTTGIIIFDAVRFCNNSLRQASVVMHTDGGGVDRYNETTGYNS